MGNWTLCIGMGIMFCQPPADPPPVDSYCQISKPIYWDSADTRKTKEQVDTHNRVWKKLCQTSTLK
jgi:hypothetical protein